MKLADLTFRQRDDLDAGEGEALEDRCRVFLIARQTIQRLG
jgi:hypothetical protein